MAAAAAGTRFAVATDSGTAALHTALLVAGVGPGDEVLVSALTFIASANAVRYAGADRCSSTASRSTGRWIRSKVRAFLENRCQWRDGALYNKASGRRVKAIMPVHVLGHPVNMRPILDLADKYGLTVIEDAAEALGARYRDPSGHERQGRPDSATWPA